MSAAPVPAATLSVDLDNHWSYLRSFGRSGWQSRPSFLNTALPRIRAVMNELELDITAFVVGVDAYDERHRDALSAVAADGHEFGNHSWEHDPGVFAGGKASIEQDVSRAEEAIEAISGARPLGFRGPSYATSEALLEILCEHNYRYDASSFPMSLRALVALYQRLNSERGSSDSGDSTQPRTTLLSSWASLHPHRIHGGRLIEVPVTTFPLLRLPIHFTYLHALADHSPWLARTYLRFALGLCSARRIPPSLLLHASDFIGADDAFDMQFLTRHASYLARQARIVDGIAEGMPQPV